LIADRDGVWNSDKNRSTSAVMYIRNDDKPILVHNYWADRPFPPGVFSCKEIRTSADGKFNDSFYEPKNAPNLATKFFRAVKAFCQKMMPR
jgi:hypothetical protein